MSSLVVFGTFFKQTDLALRVLALACLVLGGALAGVACLCAGPACTYFPRSTLACWVFPGILTVTGSTIIRYAHGLHLVLNPLSISLPALLYFAIGGSEEVIYRGMLLNAFWNFGPLAAVLLTCLGHSAYKFAIHAFSPCGNLWAAIEAFGVAAGGGFVMGLTRVKSGSVLPCICLHGLYDILVHGDRTELPWWIW